MTKSGGWNLLLPIIRIIKSRSVQRMEKEWARGMHGRQREMDIEFWWENLQERDYQQDLGIDGRNNTRIDLK